MSELTGIGVGRGVVVGPVLQMPEPLAEPINEPRDSGIEASTEYDDVIAALGAVAEDLSARAHAVGGQAKEVLEASALMARDPALAKNIRDLVDAGKTGERAVFEAFAAFRTLLESLGGYMAERATDLGDVAQRVIAKLRGVPAPGVPQSDVPFILAAVDLAPADTATLDLDKTLALITSSGGPTSHTAILARALGIPAIVGVIGATEIPSETRLVVDARAGLVVVDPTEAQVAAAEEKAAKIAAIAEAPHTPGALADGYAVPLLANVGKPEDAEAALAAGAEGVGLFRTEFLFLNSDQAPSVESQTASYVKLLSAFPGKKVVVRVLDAGADKPLAFLTADDEENPALGVRGIRALRDHENILRDQLQALADADAQTSADLWVMAPMVADAVEAKYFVEIATEYGLKTVGAMAEVPSIALVADQVLEHAAFVSIGTNDLTQYTMAADRLLGTVGAYQNPWHPAVLRLIKLIADAGKKHGKAVGVCGEAAADPDLAVVLVGLGVTTLSMSASAIADVRAELALHTLDDAKALAAKALAAYAPGVASL